MQSTDKLSFLFGSVHEPWFWFGPIPGSCDTTMLLTLYFGKLDNRTCQSGKFDGAFKSQLDGLEAVGRERKPAK